MILVINNVDGHGLSNMARHELQPKNSMVSYFDVSRHWITSPVTLQAAAQCCVSHSFHSNRHVISYTLLIRQSASVMKMGVPCR